MRRLSIVMATLLVCVTGIVMMPFLSVATIDDSDRWRKADMTKWIAELQRRNPSLDVPGVK